MNTNCIPKSIGEVRECDWRGINGDLLPICIPKSAHPFGIVGQVELGTVYSVFVVEPFGGVADALLARVLDGL